MMRAVPLAATFTILVGLLVACSDDDPSTDNEDGGAGTAGKASAGSGGGGSGGSAGRAGSGGQAGSAGRAGSGGGGGSGGTAGSGGTGGSGGTAGSGGSGGLVTYGSKYEGGVYHLGPVDWEETEWNNACSPEPGVYRSEVQRAEGQLLAALPNTVPNVAHYCDSCIHVQTARGKSAILRVVTFGVQNVRNSIDVSPAAFEILHSDEYPRHMTWQFVKCPATGNIMYDFNSKSQEWWVSFWVRNARIPITRVELRGSANASFVTLERAAAADGAVFTPGDARLGAGPFTIRVTAIDGQQLTHSFSWPADQQEHGPLFQGNSNFR